MVIKKLELVQLVLRVDLVIFILKCIILGMDFFSSSFSEWSLHFSQCLVEIAYQKVGIDSISLSRRPCYILAIFLFYANNNSSPTKPCKQQNNKVSWKRRKNKKNILQPQFIHFTNYFYFFVNRNLFLTWFVFVFLNIVMYL